VRKTVVTTDTTTTTFYLVDERNPSGYAQVLEEWVSVNTQPATLARAYSYGHDLISQRQGGGATQFYGYDGHGSTRLLTDAAGAVTDTYTYDAFGILIAQTHAGAATPNNYLYAGEQFDPDLGLYYNRARYLNPNTGRFWSMDAFEGNNSDPLSLHKYLYAHSNPANGTDPSGESLSAGTLATIGIGLIVANIVWNGIKPAFKDRTADNPGAVGPAGGWEGVIPVWGIGRDALDEFQNGEYIVGSVDVFFAATDVATISKGVFVGLTKGGAGVVVKATGKGAVGKRGGLVVLKNSGRTWPQHHIFPQAFRNQFARMGINIDKFTLKIPSKLHSFLHAQGDKAFPGGVWNGAWKDFFKMNPNATIEDAYKFAAELMTKYGLSDYAIVSYL
jgi:RHS repeat-associated protein